VKEYLEAHIENITHTRITTLYKHCSKLLCLHLISSLHVAPPPLTILKDKATSAQTLYCALRLLTQHLDDDIIQYLMANPQATKTQIERFKDTTLHPLFTALYNHSKPGPDAGPFDSNGNLTLTMDAQDKVMAYLPLATVHHAAHVAKRRNKGTLSRQRPKSKPSCPVLQLACTKGS